MWDWAHFEVMGATGYDVNIAYSPADKEFELSCTCPYFDDGFNCKHLWAALLEGDRLQILRSSRVREWLRPPNFSPRRSGRSVSKQIQRKLERDQNYGSSKRSKLVKETSRRRGLYAIDVRRSAERNQIQLHLFAQENLKKGGLGTQKAADLTHAKIQLYEDPLEREFLWDLIGRTEVLSSYYGGYSSPHDKINSLALTTGHADLILRKIFKAGKLFQFKEAGSRNYGHYEKPELIPLVYETEKWNFQLRLQKSEKDYFLHGELVSEQGSRQDVSQVVAVIEHFVFFADSLARSDLSLHSVWYELVKKNPLRLSEMEIESFLDYFWRQSSSKIPIELPAEMQFTRESGLASGPADFF